MKSRLGQYYIIKPIALIMTIIVLFFMLFSLKNFGLETRQDALEIEMVSDTSSTLSILANSVDCIAYDSGDTGAYGAIVSADRLNEFQTEYQAIEPECARNYAAGWHVVVEDQISGDKWEFGSPKYSASLASKADETVKVSSMPVAIRHSDSEINPGKIVITAYYGQLERIAGFIDYACMAGIANNEDYTDTIEMYLERPIINDEGKLCVVLGSDRVCRDMYCDMLFSGIDSDGEYSISVKYVASEKRVVVRA